MRSRAPGQASSSKRSRPGWAPAPTGRGRCDESVSRSRAGGAGPGRSAFRRSRHTTRLRKPPLGSLVVTHPFHPLFGERLEVLYVRRLRTGRVYVCDGGGGRNVALAEEATDRGPEPAERPLTLELLVEVAAVIAAIGGG